MKTMIFSILCLFLGIKICSLEATTECESEHFKYQLSVCAVFKNESPYLKEWLEYHHLLGIDHFYLYDNESNDQFREILDPYIHQGIVTLVSWPSFAISDKKKEPSIWMLSTKIPAYENVVKTLALDETKWLIFLDLEEFLVPVNRTNLVDFLNKHSDSPGICIQTNCYSSFSSTWPSRENLVIESLDITSTPQEHIEKKMDKIIFKPSEYKAFSWPPYRCIFKNNRPPLKTDQNEIRINRYLNRFKNIIDFSKERERVYVDNRLLSPKESQSILNAGYSFEDQERAIYRFLPQLKERLNAISEN